MIFKAVDVTSITGETISGPLTSWQTPNGPLNVEHLAGMSPAGDLLVFWWSPAHDWQSVNVSRVTGETIAGPPTSWQTRNGPYLVEHLAAVNARGDVLVFWWSPQQDWQSVNISAITGVKISGGLTSWQTPNGPFNVEHLAGMTPTGDLIVFWWSPQHDWQAVNVTRITGAKVAGAVTSWQTPNGPNLVEHLGGVSPQGHVLVFWWSAQSDWQVVDVTEKTGVTIVGTLCSWQTKNGPQNVEHLAGRSTSDDLVVFWWSPTHDWQAVNVSQTAHGQKVSGDPVSWQTRQGTFLREYLACQGPGDSLVVFWWSPQYDWQAIDNTPIIRHHVATRQTAWKTASGSAMIDHLAANDATGRLMVFYHSTAWEKPWAALLVAFQDDPGDTPGDPFAPVELFERFFTARGANTWGAVRYFSQMSHGNLDGSASRVVPVTVKAKWNDFIPPDPAPAGWKPKYDEYGMLELARQAAVDAGTLLKTFGADVLTSNHGIFPTHGGILYSNVLGTDRGFCFGDRRYVQDNGTQSFGHEMGHGFGMDHSRAVDPDVNVADCPDDTLHYRDPWDKMSTFCDYSAPDADYTKRGPGFNAWNMRARGWLDESRVWKRAGDCYEETIELRPLHRIDLPGFLAAELPPNDAYERHGRYLVEFRMKEDWDDAIPRSCVLVHHLEGNQSYIHSKIVGGLDLVVGDTCAPWVDGKRHPSVHVLAIDEANRTATVRLNYYVAKP